MPLALSGGGGTMIRGGEGTRKLHDWAGECGIDIVREGVVAGMPDKNSLVEPNECEG